MDYVKYIKERVGHDAINLTDVLILSAHRTAK